MTFKLGNNGDRVSGVDISFIVKVLFEISSVVRFSSLPSKLTSMVPLKLLEDNERDSRFVSSNKDMGKDPSKRLPLKSSDCKLYEVFVKSS